jgi:hypothetical protein
MTKSYLVSFVSLIFISFIVNGCSSANSQDHRQEYTRYVFKKNKTISIPKNSPSDILYWVHFIDKSTLAYYSKVTDSITLHNHKTKQTTAFKVSYNKETAVNVGISNVSDSILLVYYSNFTPYVDKRIFLINRYTLEKDYSLEIKDTNFLNSCFVTIDSFVRNQYLKNQKDELGFGPSFVSSKGDKFYLPLHSGSNKKHYQNLYSTDKTILKITSDTSYQLNIRFNHLNSNFNDSLGVFHNSFNFMPTICSIDSSHFLINYKLAGDFILCDVENESTSIISGFPEFLENKASLFANPQARSILNQTYSFPTTYSSDKSSLFIRGINIPYQNVNSKELLSATRYIVYSKMPTIEPLGVIDMEITGEILGIDFNNNIYVCDIQKSAANKDNFIINQYEIEANTIDSGFYYPKSTNNGNDKNDNILEYISTIDASLAQQDTVAILFTYNVCGSCITKIGHFLSTVNQSKSIVKNLILVSSNKFQAEKFCYDYNILNSNFINIDSVSLALEFMPHPNALCYAIKKNGIYEIEKIPIEEINNLADFLNPNFKFIGDICVPKKEY